MDKDGVQKRGFVFRNHVDRAWQVAKQDGTGVVVVNEVAKQDGDLILAVRSRISGSCGDPVQATRKLLDYLVGMGYLDQFNSSRSGVQEALQREDDMKYEADGAGVCIRVGKPVDVVRITGHGKFQGPIVHEFDGDAVLVQHAPGKVNLCQSDVFERTYTFADGSPGRVSDLPIGFSADAPAPKAF